MVQGLTVHVGEGKGGVHMRLGHGTELFFERYLSELLTVGHLHDIFLLFTKSILN
jgi:hypothetical protein